MPALLGLDLGTTSIVSLALDAATGVVLARSSRRNAAECTSDTDRARGRSEWDPERILALALETLAELAAALPRLDPVGLGITGQQHGVLLVDRQSLPLGSLINWQDQRGEEPHPREAGSVVEAARRRLGEAARARTGCRLATGYLATTLFSLAQTGTLLTDATACFLMDWVTARLSASEPVTDPTCAASSGILDVATGQWADDLIAALELPRTLFPPVLPSGSPRGGLAPEIAARTGLPAGLPVFGGIGDNQASFLGSVADRADSVLVNVGTGGQVAFWSPEFLYDPRLETRPFPGGGVLLVSAGLAGGAAYGILERFFRAVGTDLFGISGEVDLFAAMNRLAASVPSGSDHVRCEPFFAGTRAEPSRRASWSGIARNSLTPGHLARSLLEGTARTFAEGGKLLREATGSERRVLIGAGNGIRANALLGAMIAEAFGQSLHVPSHPEEAAYGAALLAGWRSGLFADLHQAGSRIRYSPETEHGT